MSLLRKFFGRAGETVPTTEAFSLPGALHEGVRLLLVASEDPTDLLFVMPFVQRVSEDVQGARLGLVCSERISHLALTTEVFGDILVVEEEHLQDTGAARKGLESMLAAEPWDVAVLVGRDPDPVRDEIALLSGAALRLGPGHARAYPRLNCEVRSPADDRYPYHRTETWGRLLGVELRETPLRWPLAEKRARQMAQLVHFNKPRKDQRLLAFDPGPGKGGARVGPQALAVVANHLLAHVPSKGIVLTAEEEGEHAKALAGRLHGELLDLPRPTLLERILLLAQCDLLVCGNTDLFHFAAALDVPVLGLFTPDDPDSWVPERARRCTVMRPRPGEPIDLAEVMDRIDGLFGRTRA